MACAACHLKPMKLLGFQEETSRFTLVPECGSLHKGKGVGMVAGLVEVRRAGVTFWAPGTCMFVHAHACMGIEISQVAKFLIQRKVRAINTLFSWLLFVNTMVNKECTHAESPKVRLYQTVRHCTEALQPKPNLLVPTHQATTDSLP